jgi:hypothetical protein
MTAFAQVTLVVEAPVVPALPEELCRQARTAKAMAVKVAISEIERRN